MQPLRAKPYSILLFVLIGMLPLSTCTPEAAPEQAVANAPTVITFGAPDADRLLYAPIIERFNQQHADIQVQFVDLNAAQPAEGGNPLRSVVSAADTAIGFVRPEDIANRYVLDLKPFIDADPTFKLADYYAAAFQPGSTMGSVYTLPQTVYLSLFAYNKTMWLAAGLPEPGPNPSWDTLIAAAEQFASTSTPNRMVYGLMDNGQGLLVLLHELETNQAKLFNVPLAQVQFDQPPVQAALQRVRELVQRGAVFAYGAQKQPITSFEDIARLVREQRLLVWPTDAIRVDAADPRLGFAVGYVAFPQLAQPAQLAGQQGYLISAGTQHPEAAWAWLSFLSKQQVGNAGLPNLPARRSLSDASGVLKRAPAEFATVATRELDRTSVNAAPVRNEGTWSALNNKPLLAVAGMLPIDQALAQAQAELASSLAEAPQPIDTKPVVVAPPIIVPDNVTQIDFITQFGDQQVLQKLADQFTQQNPTIQVQVRYAGSTNGSDSLPEIAQAADCFIWNAAPQSQEISATLDLQPFVNADASFAANDYPAGVLAPFRYQNRLYGIPLTVQLRALAYNQDLLEQRGAALPTAESSYADLLRIAEQVTQAKNQPPYYGYTTSSVIADDLPFFLDRLGATPSQTPQIQLTDPTVLQAAQYYLSLLRQSPTPHQVSGYRAGMLVWSDLISSGQTGWWLTFDANPPTVAGTRIRLIAPPLGLGALRTSDIAAVGMYISAQTTHSNECWQWLSFLSRSQLQINKNAFPARRSVAESAAFVQQAAPDAQALYAAYLPLQASTSTPFGDPSFEPFWLYQAIDRALQGGDLERELAEAQTKTTAYLQCMEAKETRRACATEADIDYQGLAPQQ